MGASTEDGYGFRETPLRQLGGVFYAVLIRGSDE